MTRLIPGNTKVKIELFKGIGPWDVVVGVIALGVIALTAVSTLPYRWAFCLFFASMTALLLFRINGVANYMLFMRMLTFLVFPKRYERTFKDEHLFEKAEGNTSEILAEIYGGLEDDEDAGEQTRGKKEKVKKTKEEKQQEKLEKKERRRQEKERRKAEKKERKSKKGKKNSGEPQPAIEDKKLAGGPAAETALDTEGDEMEEIMPFTAIRDGFIEYDGQYYGAVIEIPPVDFRFFSEIRKTKSIEQGLGPVLRSLSAEMGANVVKLDRPVSYDDYLEREYDKLDELKAAYENGFFSEEELMARVEIAYDRIYLLRTICYEDKVLDSFYYLVLFDKNKSALDTMMINALHMLHTGEMEGHRLDDKELAIFLKYTNQIDFEERDYDELEDKEWDHTQWAMPETLIFRPRTVEVNNIVTHNMKIHTYPMAVNDAWLARVMSMPATKVVMKCRPMEREKALKSIDYSLAELRSQYVNTNVDSKRIELEGHISTLSNLLVTLQGENEQLLEVGVYVTIYDLELTNKDPRIVDKPESIRPRYDMMKRLVRRIYSEENFKLKGMDFNQHEAFVGSQVSAYDPDRKNARGIPSNTVASSYPWIYSSISDPGGIFMGSNDGVPVFIDFFRRDSERVNSNMVVIGKSGSGKSYATKALLANLAADDSKIFILDPENEYTELANTLNGKVINVGNAKYGRLNPFHIITALEDDEIDEAGPAGSFATHLQFLEEFFKQILPDIDKDALEYLNTLVERMYHKKKITPETDLSNLRPSDYPVFDDLYDEVLIEFERTDNEFLKTMLRSLVNYIGKFSTGGRNANIWNGPSTVTTESNFTVFNFQSMLANRNMIIGNAQMLLVLKYIDNEIIKNREYNEKYGLKRKICVVIDEAHVFIDDKYPVALDFMFQLAKRIRKYNGMQIVITQNVKDFVGTEEIARKSMAIINACQYSFIFALSPNDMTDLTRLYQNAGGINEQEQEQITSAPRGQAFTIMSPTSRSTITVEVDDDMVDMFSNKEYESAYFVGSQGQEFWDRFVGDSRELHKEARALAREAEVHTREVEEKKSHIVFTEVDENGEIISPEDSTLQTLAWEPEESEDQNPEAEEAAIDLSEFEGITFEKITFEEVEEEEPLIQLVDEPEAEVEEEPLIQLVEEPEPEEEEPLIKLVDEPEEPKAPTFEEIAAEAEARAREKARRRAEELEAEKRKAKKKKKKKKKKKRKQKDLAGGKGLLTLLLGEQGYKDMVDSLRDRLQDELLTEAAKPQKQKKNQKPKKPTTPKPENRTDQTTPTENDQFGPGGDNSDQ